MTLCVPRTVQAAVQSYYYYTTNTQTTSVHAHKLNKSLAAVRNENKKGFILAHVLFGRRGKANKDVAFVEEMNDENTAVRD